MSKQAKPEWSGEIRSLIETLGLSQKRLGILMGVSPATVTRWINGSHEPTPAAYMALGNLIGQPRGAYFWDRAGLDPANFSETKLSATLASQKVDLKDLQIVSARRLSKELITHQRELVLVPLLNLMAYGDETPKGPPVSLSRAEIIDLFVAPTSWCPHPENALCMRLSGDSMVPLIPDGSIVCIDTAVATRELLDKKVCIFFHRDLGYKVARLRRLPSSDVLVSANHNCMPVEVTDSSKWKAVGEVIWWLAKDPSTIGKLSLAAQ